jgi:hypothetical protein
LQMHPSLSSSLRGTFMAAYKPDIKILADDW